MFIGVKSTFDIASIDVNIHRAGISRQEKRLEGRKQSRTSDRTVVLGLQG